MSDLRPLAYVLLWAAAICQAILLWLQIRAYARYKHKSFVVLAAGTVLGLALAVITMLVSLAPAVLSSPKALYAAALICGIAQVPLALLGVAWLFRSYGELQSAARGVLPNTSFERTREG